jgi:hypothetical protein
MKYVITESQHEKLKDLIWDYLDCHLTPYIGWESPKSYEMDIEEIGEIFFFLVESIGDGEDEHMRYSACDNNNWFRHLPEDDCPVVSLPSAKYEALDAFFGDMWKPIFLEWFKFHTKLPIVKVNSQGF